MTLNDLICIHCVRHTEHPVPSIEHPLQCMVHPVHRKYPIVNVQSRRWPIEPFDMTLKPSSLEMGH